MMDTGSMSSSGELLTQLRRFVTPEPLSPLFQSGGFYAGWNEDLIQLMICIAVLTVVDFTIVRPLIVKKARYFALHAVTNFFVAATAFPDLYRALADPLNAFRGPSSTIWPNSAVAAIHIYHCIAFPLRAEDIFHHVRFVILLCALGVPFKQDYGAVSNFGCFFLSGIPGGMDYVMLVLVAHGKMKKMTEKIWNARINVWLRGPSMTVFAFLAWQAWFHDKIGSLPPLALLLTTLLYFINGQFYARQAVESYTKAKDADRAGREAVKETKKVK